MGTEYNSGSFQVKNFVCLTHDNCGCRFAKMNYGERLIRAREHAKLTQAQLSERLGKDADGKDYMSQSNISALERDPKTKGSLHTVKLARACGINPDWLAYEEGEMITSSHAEDPKARAVLLAMQQMPEYKKDMLVAASNTLAEQPSEKGNGTQ